MSTKHFTKIMGDEKMIAYHGKQEIKDQYLARVKAHREADEIVKGTYWEGGKGCAVGCTIHGSSHAQYEVELGIPRILARLEDGIFESIPNELAMTWPERFLDAIKPGADLSLVWPKFAVWMLIDSQWGVLQFAKIQRAKEAIERVADLYSKQIEGVNLPVEVWRDAAADAYAADAYAADAAAAAAAAAYAAAAAAAYAAAAAADAAYAADDAAYAATAAAAYAADAADARRTWRIAQSEKLLELLRGEGK